MCTETTAERPNLPLAESDSCCSTTSAPATNEAASSSCCSTEAATEPVALASCHSDASTHGAAPATASDDTAVCPVMAGSVVIKSVAEAQGLFRDYEGNRYWFCCAACGPLWDADPAKYADAA